MRRSGRAGRSLPDASGAEPRGVGWVSDPLAPGLATRTGPAGRITDRTDAELIKAAHRDPEPFGELYSRHVRSIDRWFSSRAPTADASELTAETFAQAALSLRRFRDEANGSAAPWLFGIAHNQLRRYRERARVETRARQRLGMPVHAYDDQFDAVDDRVAASVDSESVRDAFGQLSAAEQSVLTLRLVDELSYDEVASRLGCSNTAARLRLMRALQHLSRLFGRAGAG